MICFQIDNLICYFIDYLESNWNMSPVNKENTMLCKLFDVF